MEEELKTEVDEVSEYENIATAVDEVQVLDMTILDDEVQVNRYLEALMYQSETFYTSIKTKMIDKVLLYDTRQVYQYHENINCFELTELPVNTEEDYIIITYTDMNENGVPIFTINTTQVETTTLQYIWVNWFTLPFYKWIFKRG